VKVYRVVSVKKMSPELVVGDKRSPWLANDAELGSMFRA